MSSPQSCFPFLCHLLFLLVIVCLPTPPRTFEAVPFRRSSPTHSFHFYTEFSYIKFTSTCWTCLFRCSLGYATKKQQRHNIVQPPSPPVTWKEAYYCSVFGQHNVMTVMYNAIWQNKCEWMFFCWIVQRWPVLTFLVPYLFIITVSLLASQRDTKDTFSECVPSMKPDILNPLFFHIPLSPQTFVPFQFDHFSLLLLSCFSFAQQSSLFSCLLYWHSKGSKALPL